MKPRDRSKSRDIVTFRCSEEIRKRLGLLANKRFESRAETIRTLIKSALPRFLDIQHGAMIRQFDANKRKTDYDAALIRKTINAMHGLLKHFDEHHSIIAASEADPSCYEEDVREARFIIARFEEDLLK